MTVWKVGCRWDKNGSASSKIISVFRRNGIIFVGEQKEIFEQIKTNDLIAIADGFTVIAVAKATCDAKPLKEITSKIKIRGDEQNYIDEDWPLENAVGVTAKIFDLPNSQETQKDESDISQIQYKKRGSCCRAYQIAIRIQKAYEKFALSSEEFSIDCETRNFGKFLESKVRYIIPVYQREYSWGEPQISKFIRDLMMGLCGVSGFDEDENGQKNLVPRENASPMFIGTMQLSFRKYITKDESEQDVIDGQQRFSTLLCLLKYLSLSCTEPSISFKDILESRVNRGKEDEFLSAAMSLNSLDDLNKDSLGNRYIENIKLIKEVLDELGFSKDYYTNLWNYIKEKILFVVITTKAGISKTLEIFNTINTAGLDLNGGDLFKVRLYEYLKDKKGKEQFDVIDALYKDVKEKNLEWRKKHDNDLISIDVVRNVYKNYLITRYELPKFMYSWGIDRFYDTLFDVCLGVAPHQELKEEKAKEISLDLDDLKKVVDAVILWNSRRIDSQEKMIADLLVSKSRYARYWQFPILYLLFIKKGASPDEKAAQIEDIYKLWQMLARIFFAYTIRYAKIVNEGISFMHQVYNMLCEGDVSCLYESLKKQLNSMQAKLEDDLGGSIVDNRKKKDLICIVSAYLKEPQLHDESSIVALRCRLSGNFDVEHIHATNDKSIEVEDRYQNSIGNLMLLEYGINRSIGDKPFKEKVKSYRRSKFAVVQEMVNKSGWKVSQIRDRLKEEKKAILDFYNNP